LNDKYTKVSFIQVNILQKELTSQINDVILFFYQSLKFYIIPLKKTAIGCFSYYKRVFDIFHL